MFTNKDFENSGFLPPQSVEAEEAILGGILLDPEAIERVAPILTPDTPDAFYVPAHGEIYRAALALYGQKKPTDLLVVSEYLTSKGRLEFVGGMSKLVQLVDRTVSAVNVDFLAKLVLEKYLRRKLIAITERAKKSAYETDTDFDETLEKIQAELFALKQANAEKLGLRSIEEICPPVWIDLEEMNTGDDTATHRCIPSGYYDLDEITGGFPLRYFTWKGARPGVGKTTEAVDIAINVAKKGIPVAFFSLEMPLGDIVKKIWGRLAAPQLRVEQLFERNAIADSDWATITNVVDKSTRLPIYIDDDPVVRPSDIRDRLRRLIAEIGQPVGLVIVDYVGLMKPDTRQANRVLEVDAILKDLRAIARELHFAGLGLVQISRAVEGRSNKRPTMSDFRESGGYEQEGAVMIGLYIDPNDPDIMENIVLKNRFGATGTAKLLFDAKHGAFRNLAKTPYAQQSSVNNPNDAF